MAKIKDIINIIQNIAPEENTITMGFEDNVGLILGKENVETDIVLCCLDVTNEVLDEAINIGAGLIISHHPFIFSSLKKITSSTPLGGKILKAAENKIAIYSSHTNLDCAIKGINDYLANLLNLKNISVLEKTVEREGMGRIGTLASPTQITKLAQEITKKLEEHNIRIIAKNDAIIKKIAIIGGAGGDIKYIDMAREMNADCLITADVKHHVALYALEAGMTVIEPTHYSMEQIFVKELSVMLNKNAKEIRLNIEFFPSKLEKSPYFTV